MDPLNVGRQYLYNYYDFAIQVMNIQGQLNENINHGIIHETGNNIIGQNGVYNRVQPIITNGNNSILLKILDPINNVTEHYLKIAYSPNRGDLDNMLLESMTKRLLLELAALRGYNLRVISSVNDVWKISGTNLRNLLIHAGIRNPPGDLLNNLNTLYDIGLIYNPITNNRSMSDIIRAGDHRLIIENILIFLRDMINIGYKLGFVHNDLHTENILYNYNTGVISVIDLGRSYTSLFYDTTREIIKNEYVKLALPASVETVDSFNRRYQKYNQMPRTEILLEFLKEDWPHVTNINYPNVIMLWPADIFQARTYILFDLIGVYSSVFVVPEMNYNENIAVLTQYQLPNLQQANLENAFSEMIIKLLAFWYIHTIETWCLLNNNHNKETAKQRLFRFYNRPIRVFRSETMHIIRGSFYRAITDAGLQDKILQMMNIISSFEVIAHNRLIRAGSKKMSSSKGSRETSKSSKSQKQSKLSDIMSYSEPQLTFKSIDIKSDSDSDKINWYFKETPEMEMNKEELSNKIETFNKIIANISKEEQKLAEKIDQNIKKDRSYEDILINNDSIRTLIDMEHERIKNGFERQQYGGQPDTKKYIVYDTKTRLVHHDNTKKQKYIVIDKQKIYLTDIRGKYRYV